MVERKSKPRTTKNEDDEPEGWDALKQNPWFILGMIILFVALLVGGVIGLSQFLSGNVALDDIAGAYTAVSHVLG